METRFANRYKQHLCQLHSDLPQTRLNAFAVNSIAIRCHCQSCADICNELVMNVNVLTTFRYVPLSQLAYFLCLQFNCIHARSTSVDEKIRNIVTYLFCRHPVVSLCVESKINWNRKIRRENCLIEELFGMDGGSRIIKINNWAVVDTKPTPKRATDGKCHNELIFWCWSKFRSSKAEKFSIK